MKRTKMFAFFAFFVLGAGVLSVFAKGTANDKQETIIVKSFHEYWGKNMVWVDYGNGRIEETKLDGYFTLKKMKSNTSIELSIIQGLNSKGYKVISHSECTIDRDIYTDTWVLTK